MTRALRIALKMLRARGCFENEIRTRCLEKNCPPSEIESALNDLRAKKLLNDARLAEHLALLWSESKGWGNERIIETLMARGAPQEAIESSIARLPPEYERAERLVRGLDSRKALYKLRSAGFSEETLEKFSFDND
ncbi:MAG TPA: RecX family transcriptional regulator [Fimbriimonadales bacterium]|nr:RecX family transcriptional regulator [Fimbriimonadales bacterium]